MRAASNKRLAGGQIKLQRMRKAALGDMQQPRQKRGSRAHRPLQPQRTRPGIGFLDRGNGLLGGLSAAVIHDQRTQMQIFELSERARQACALIPTREHYAGAKNRSSVFRQQR